MNLNNYADHFTLEYIIIRRYIISVLCESQLNIHDMNFLYPLENINRKSLSLTDRIDPDNQIRYFLSGRTLRKIAEFASKIAEKKISELIIDPCHIHSVFICHFIKALQRMNVSIQYASLPNLSDQAGLTENEIELIQQLIIADRGDRDLLVRCIRQVTNCGDVFSAENLLEHGLKYYRNFESEHANLIGTIKNCVGKPIEAEYYYKIFKCSDDPLAPVRANYPLAMLYLRHHKPEKRNFEMGKIYLTEAYEYIERGGLDFLEPEEKAFYTVFNRNGYGLVLFREGKINEAIEILNWGMNTLSDESPKHYMHRSVILYNIGQCYKQIADYDSAIQCYQDLLEIDYVFPEYHLEMGLCYKQKGCLKEYKACIEEALRLNPWHSDSHYCLSMLLTEHGDIEAAEHHARMAWELSGDDMTAYNYAYTQSINGKYYNLTQLQPVNSPEYVPQWIILRAEEQSQTSLSAALRVLQEGVTAFPEHADLNVNINLIQEIIANA
ncbi:TPA: tetratricopeptide repeat protein [Citrobacter freundii]